MAGENNIPERLINFRVYAEGNDLLGVATVDLPELQAMSDTVSGAGIAGEVESPVLGHFGSMTTKLSWRTIEKSLVGLAKPGSHALEIRGSQQIYDASNGVYSTVPVRCSMRVANKTSSLGSFTPGSSTGSEQEFEVTYIKLEINKKEVVEIDKFNYIAKFDGEDVLSGVRADLGLS